MLPRTDLIVSYNPLPHVARSAIIEKNHFRTRESPEIIIRGKLEPVAGGRSREFLPISRKIAKNQERKKESSWVDLVDV